MNARLVRFLVGAVFSCSIFLPTTQIFAQSADDTVLATWKYDHHSKTFQCTLYKTRDSRLFLIKKNDNDWQQESLSLSDSNDLLFHSINKNDYLEIGTGNNKVLYKESQDGGVTWNVGHTINFMTLRFYNDKAEFNDVLSKLEAVTGQKGSSGQHQQTGF